MVTIQLIAEHDVSGVSVDMVAERAGVSKATIYRRWSSREDLIFEAMSYIAYPQANPDTGTVRGDLVVLVTELVHFLNRPDGGSVYAAFLNAATRNSKIAALRGNVSSTARLGYYTAIEKGIERGELRSDIDLDLLVETLIAAFVYRRIGSREDVPEQLVDRTIDLLLAGVATPNT